MELTRKRILLAAACVISLAGAIYLGSFLWTYSKLQGVVLFDWGRTMKQDLVHFEIANHRFAMPVSYLYNRKSWEGGKTKAVNFDAVLPDLRPYSQGARSEFEKLGYHNKVILMIHARETHVTVPRGFENNKQRFAFKGYIDKLSGLQLFSAADQLDRQEMYAKLEGDRVVYYAICAKVEVSPSPSCQSFIDYADDLYINYSFGRQHLNNWQELEQRVRELMRSFEVAAQK